MYIQYERGMRMADDYRINLKLRPEYKQYLSDEAWKAKTSVTEYINDLIAADIEIKKIKNLSGTTMIEFIERALPLMEG